MSIEALSIVLNHSKAKGAAKLVLIGIANHLGPDADEGAWPSQARLASYANVSDRAVRDAIEALEQLGELRKEQAGGHSRNQYKPNRYWIDLRCPDTCDGSLGHNSVEVSSSQGGSFQQTGWKPASDESLRETEKNLTSDLKLLFAEFWKEYPKAPQYRTERKSDAMKEFKSALARAKFEDILAGAIAYANDPKENRYKLIAVKWLRNDGWENATQPNPDTERARLNSERRERELARSNSYLAELKEQEAKAAPPPKCEHGLTIVRCKTCLTSLD